MNYKKYKNLIREVLRINPAVSSGCFAQIVRVMR